MKKLLAKIGTYEKDGATKNRYAEIGVILSNDNGEFALLNPTVDLAGVLMKQKEFKPDASNIMCSIFDNSNQGQSGGYQNQQNPTSVPAQQPAPAGGNDGFDDDIPF